MANDHRTPNEIEREIERDRADLVRTINTLQDRFSPETLVAEAVRTARTHGGDLGHAVSESAKQNPVGLAITGIGLAWMIFGRSYADRPATSRAPAEPAFRRRPTQPPSAAGAYPDWYIEEEEDVAEYYGYPIGARANVPGDDGDADDGPYMTDRARSGASAAAGSVSSGAGKVAGGVSSGAGKVAGGVSAAGSSVADGAASVRDGAAAAAHSGAESARRMRERLAHGTEALGTEARERVIAARRRAVLARQKMSESAGRNWKAGRETAVGMFEDNPLIAGALAIAAGAALAAALPSTRKEDELFGGYSDDLMDEAERVYLEELDKAERVGRAALDETRKIVEEKGAEADAAASGVADAVKDEVSEAGKRIKSAAEKEAKSKPSDRDA